MRIKTTTLMTLLLLGTAWATYAVEPAKILWKDDDSRNIPEPKARSIGLYEAFFSSEMSEQWKKGLDVPRWLRHAVGAPKQAANVNAVDEVPDSSWYTNRHALRHMTIQQLVQGPNQGEPPDFSHATITKAKMEGVTPGLQLKDNRGDDYLIKFDNKDYPELQSGAEVISTKIMYAAGYNVPENYVAYLDPARLEIKEGVEFSHGGSKHPFSQKDLTKLLENAAKRTDGTYRVLASKILKGTSKGSFPWIGLRTDDPNDLIPHEHRRELRGLRVIASWINHWDLKELNTLDMYVGEGGRKFLRHYLIDFGSSLGGGKSPTEYFHGREYAFDGPNIWRELFTLGFYVTPDEKSGDLTYPEVGLFSARDFDPGNWVPSFHVMPFENMTHEDAYWGTRIILSFSDDELLNIVKTAEYSNPRATELVLRTLLERRRLIAAHWLKDVNPIANFALDSGKDGVALKFSDLLADHDLARSAAYQYEIAGAGRTGEGRQAKETASAPRILLGQNPVGETRVRIRTVREGHTTSPVTIYMNNKPGGGYGIYRIERS
jgi:hypothetical protein